MDSILNTIKDMLGIQEDYTHFDKTLIAHINSAITILTQNGVGPESGFRVEDAGTSWDGLIQDLTDIDSVKSFVYLRTMLLFDTTISSYQADIINKQADEYLWRINVAVELRNKEKMT